VTDIMGEITSASQEQSQGIDQINTVIVEMDNTTQQNAALVEEAAAASKALKDQTDNLMHVINAFKISDKPRSTEQATEKKLANKVESIRTVATAKAIPKPSTRQITEKKPVATLIKHEEKKTPKEDDWEEF